MPDSGHQVTTSGLYAAEPKLLDVNTGKGNSDLSTAAGDVAATAAAAAADSYSPQTSMEHHVTSHGDQPDLMQTASVVNPLSDARDALDFPYKNQECDTSTHSYYTK